VRPNTAPALRFPVVVSAEPGRTLSTALPVTDAEGDPVTVVPLDLDRLDGLVLESDSSRRWWLTWTPTTTGTSVVPLVLRDDRGATRRVDVTVRATNPYRDGTLIGMGDSVASGHGLQKRDYLGGDDCWRSGDEAYPRLVFDALVHAGSLDPGGYNLVACSGATLGDLLEEPVTGGPSGMDGRRSQVEWVVAANPEVVTLTAGANTLGFVHPEQIFDDALEIDTDELERRLQRVETGLAGVLGRLVDHTDSTVYVTNYYNPVAATPQGVAGCRNECFQRRVDEVLASFNATIEAVAARFPAGRVVLVDIAGPFVGHGAPNGLGPDGLRSGTVGWLRGLIGDPVGGVHPYCAQGHGDAGSWVNYVDCVHPDGRGHREIADAVLAAARSGARAETGE
jgi:lysophospholipase L1-like esterase